MGRSMRPNMRTILHVRDKRGIGRRDRSIRGGRRNLARRSLGSRSIRVVCISRRIRRIRNLRGARNMRRLSWRRGHSIRNMRRSIHRDRSIQAFRGTMRRRAGRSSVRRAGERRWRGFGRCDRGR